MGRYNVVVEDDEDVVWEKDEGGNVTHILLVGFIDFWLRFKLSPTRKMIVIMVLMLHLRFHRRSISARLL